MTKQLTLSKSVLENSKTVNQLLTLANIKPVFQNHVIIIDKRNRDNDICGIEALIENILATHGASFPLGVELTEYRPMAIKASLFASQIFDITQAMFSAGTSRYPANTVKMYLSRFAKHIGKIQLTKNEDFSRTCCKPRTKYYLAK
jgi:hypothetical protein